MSYRVTATFILALSLSASINAMYPSLKEVTTTDVFDDTMSGKKVYIMQELLALAQCDLQQLRDKLMNSDTEDLRNAINNANLGDNRKEALNKLVDDLKDTLSAIEMDEIEPEEQLETDQLISGSDQSDQEELIPEETQKKQRCYRGLGYIVLATGYSGGMVVLTSLFIYYSISFIKLAIIEECESIGLYTCGL